MGAAYFFNTVAIFRKALLCNASMRSISRLSGARDAVMHITAMNN
jgi:hypothetical protein